MMKKTRIVNVLHIASGDLWAGAEVQLFTLAKTLNNQRGVNINVVLLNHGTLEQRLLDNGINVTVLDESKLNGLQILWRLISTIRTIKPDVIHTHRIKENILGSTAALLTHSTPSLRTTHGAPEHKPAWFHVPKRLILLIDWLCARFLQKKIIAVSDDLAEILKKEFPAGKINVIENGIDLESFTAVTNSNKYEHVKPAIEPDNPSFRVGIAGRLVPIKRFDIFIETAAKVLSAHPELNISFHIFGDGPLHAELTALNHKLNTKKFIHFEGHCKNMQQELANLDILLITSDHEGLPMILLEAMALKTSVIAHAVGGIPAVLDQGKCGILITDHQPSTYADAIYQLIINPESRNNYIDNAVNQVTTHYSNKQNANSYLLTYKHLIELD